MFPPGRAEPWNLPTTHWITLCTKRRRAHLDPLKCFRVDADGPVWKGASKQPFFPPTWYENVQYIRNLSAEHGSQDSLNLCCRFLVRLLLNAAGLVVGNRHHDYVATGVFSLKVLISHAIQSTDFNWLSLQLNLRNIALEFLGHLDDSKLNQSLMATTNISRWFTPLVANLRLKSRWGSFTTTIESWKYQQFKAHIFAGNKLRFPNWNVPAKLDSIRAFHLHKWKTGCQVRWARTCKGTGRRSLCRAPCWIHKVTPASTPVNQRMRGHD